MGGRQDASGVVAAVVTVTFNRPQYLERHLQSVLEVHRRHTDHRSFLTALVLVAVLHRP